MDAIKPMHREHRSLLLDAHTATIFSPNEVSASTLRRLLLHGNGEERVRHHHGNAERLLAYFRGGEFEHDLFLPASEFLQDEVIARMFPIPATIPALASPAFDDHSLTQGAWSAMLGAPDVMELFGRGVQRFMDELHIPKSVARNVEIPAQRVVEMIHQLGEQHPHRRYSVCLTFMRVLASTFLLEDSASFASISAVFNGDTLRALCKKDKNALCGLNGAYAITPFCALLQHVWDGYKHAGKWVAAEEEEKGVLSDAPSGDELFEEPEHVHPASLSIPEEVPVHQDPHPASMEPSEIKPADEAIELEEDVRIAEAEPETKEEETLPPPLVAAGRSRSRSSAEFSTSGDDTEPDDGWTSEESSDDSVSSRTRSRSLSRSRSVTPSRTRSPSPYSALETGTDIAEIAARAKAEASGSPPASPRNMSLGLVYS